jgi:hypothetical protein
MQISLNLQYNTDAIYILVLYNIILLHAIFTLWEGAAQFI